MPTDNLSNNSSTVLYNKYTTLFDTTAELVLKNNTIVKGRIIGHFYQAKEQSFIQKWHIADSSSLLGIDAFGYLEGTFIDHSDIKSVHFNADNSTLHC